MYRKRGQGRLRTEVEGAKAKEKKIGVTGFFQGNTGYLILVCLLL